MRGGLAASIPGPESHRNLWAILDRRVSMRLPSGADEVEKATVEEWNLLPQTMIDKLVGSFIGRLERCVELGGGLVC